MPVVTRVASLLIVVTLAASPATGTVWCLAWCAAAPEATPEGATCHRLAEHLPAVVAGNGNCGLLSNGTPFMREETKREAPVLALEHAGWLPRGHTPDPRPPDNAPDRWARDLAPPAFTAVLRI